MNFGKWKRENAQHYEILSCIPGYTLVYDDIHSITDYTCVKTSDAEAWIGPIRCALNGTGYLILCAW